MSKVAIKPEENARQPSLSWWTLNLCLVCLFLCVWLLLTMLGSWTAQNRFVGASQFLLSAQWIPLSYLALVVVYSFIMNRCAARYASAASEAQSRKRIDEKAL